MITFVIFGAVKHLYLRNIEDGNYANKKKGGGALIMPHKSIEIRRSKSKSSKSKSLSLGASGQKRRQRVVHLPWS